MGRALPGRGRRAATYSLSRATSAVLLFVALHALENLGAGVVFTGSAVILVLLCLDVAVLGPHSTGRSLETAARPAGAGLE
ncbi:hypothetical protein NE235_02305 [Actinoallomurus spadix]|uniref:hypothetical protein n=1 Tax=Actinoallomurus spadix TaxID=79912 RepID=UPI00209388AA|nr:hypothetical protein [Actinoallomurus spadix]MCO5984935.1 hypothetical protein [Actinoallomurus spadix]